MPVIPKSTRTQTITDQVPNVQVSPEFGQAVFKGLEQTGTNLQDVAEFLQKKQIDRQNKINKSILVDRLADWETKLRNKKIEFSDRKYESALNLYDDSQKWVDSELDAYMSKLPPEIQADFKERASSSNNSFLNAMATHQVAETENFHKSAYGKSFDVSKTMIAEDPINEELFQSRLAEAFDLIDTNSGGDSKMKEVAQEELDKTRLESLYLSSQMGSVQFVLNKAGFDKIKDSVKDQNLVKKYEVLYKKEEENQSKLGNAVKAQTIAEQAISSVKEIDPSMPFDIESAYGKVKEMTDDPEIRKDAFALLEREKKVKDQGIKERFEYNYSAISSALQQDKNMTIADIKTMPEFYKIPETQRDDVIAKAQTLIDTRSTRERSVVASERAADAAMRAQENAEIARQQAIYDKEYNLIMGDPDKKVELGTMSDEQFKGLILTVGDKNQAKLLNEREKLQKDNRYISISRQITEIVNKTLKSANITNEADKKLYMDAVTEYIGDETDTKKIREKAAEAIQNATLSKPLFGRNRVVINATPQKTIVGTVGGKPVYEINGDQWEIGD